MGAAEDLAVLNKKPLHVDDKQEKFPQLIYDPIRSDVQKFLEEKAPALSLSVEEIAVRRLPDDSGYGGVFLAGNNAFWYAMTGKGLQYKAASDLDKAQEVFDNMMQREQAKSRLVRQQESQKDLELVLDLGKSTRAEREEFKRESHVLVFKAKKIPCGKCGGTSYNDIRGRLGDCCLPKRPKMTLVKKALPQSKEAPVKQAKPAGKATSKKQGKGAKGKVRYNYPTEKGKPGAAPKVKKPNAKSKQGDEPQKKKKPSEQVAGSKPQPQPDPVQIEFADPAKLARVLRIDVAALKTLAMKFQSSSKMNGRKGFTNFMMGKLSQFSKKHNLDAKYFGLVYDALVSTTSGPAPRDPKES